MTPLDSTDYLIMSLFVLPGAIALCAWAFRRRSNRGHVRHVYASFRW
jgi:hypothetical protein